MGLLQFTIPLAMFVAAPAAVVPPPAAPTQAPPPAVMAWVGRNAANVGPLDQPPAPAEAATIDRIIGAARVIGLGESNHGNREPLAYRNRLVAYLAVHRGLTAVALESGLAESHRLYSYVLGGAGDPRALVRSGLTHGFGQLEANVALVEWLRAWNHDHPARLVRLYGIDRSTIQSGPPGHSSETVLEELTDYLARTVPARSAVARGVFARLMPQFNESGYPGLTDADRHALDAALADTEALLRTNHAAIVAATSADAYDWAAREAYDAARLPELFRSWSVDASDLARLKHLLDLRDGAMADHVLWVVHREGAKGRVLLFQANGHVAAAPMVGSVMRLFPEQPLLTGEILRQRLGRDYRAIATASSRGRGADDPASGSIDRAFAAAGRQPVLLALAAPRRPGWWSQLQTASQGDARLDDMVPAVAFDGFVYFAQLTALPRPQP